MSKEFQQTTTELTILAFISKTLEMYSKLFKVKYYSSFNIREVSNSEVLVDKGAMYISVTLH
jgi:hypothetical protein